MSLVGPRPALPKEVAEFPPELRHRESVTPGITGLWQVEARDNPSFEAYRRLDLFYVENWSITLDLMIVIGTLEQLVVKVFATIRPQRTARRRRSRRSPRPIHLPDPRFRRLPIRPSPTRQPTPMSRTIRRNGGHPEPSFLSLARPRASGAPVAVWPPRRRWQTEHQRVR